MQNSVAKKIFAVGVAASTVFAAVAPFVAFAAVHADGTNVSDASGTVSMIVGGQRRPYTSAGAFLSYGFNSFASVVSASAEDLALPVGTFIPPQDGSIICSDRGADKGTCYQVSNAMKFGFTSAAVFTGLGFSFKNSMAGDVSWMSAGSTLIGNTTMAHLPGTLVNNNGTVQLMGGSGLLGVPDLATFNSWGYSFSKVVPANAADKAMSQTGVMVARMPGQLSPSWTTTPGVTPTPVPGVVNGSVSAMLGSDTPAANTVIAGQAVADLAHFAFSGTGTVTQVVLRRIGVSADTSLANVYLYVGNNKITDAASVSNGTVTFNNPSGIFTVNGSMVVSVKSDISATASAGQSVGVQLASLSVASGSPMSTSISGNLMNIATVSDLATVALTAVPLPSSTGNITAGTMNASLWSGNFNVGQRKVWLKYVAFKQVGSIPSGALQNLKLYVAGAPVGNPVVSLDSSNNVVFDMTGSPVTLNTGAQTIELRGDVVKGSSFNYTFRLQTASDIVVVDSNYGVNVTASTSGGASFPATTGAQTVSQGSVSTQQDSSYNQTQVVKNSSNVTLGQWTMKAYGEDVKVQTMNVVLNYFDVAGNATTASATEGFNNLSVYVGTTAASAGAVGSSQSTVGSSGTTQTKTYGTSNLFTIPAGTTVSVVVKGDMALDSVTKVNSVRADLVTPATSMQGVTSYQTFPVSLATFQGISQTVVTSSITTAKNGNLANGTISSNVQNQKIGSFTVQASNADGVRVSSLTIGLSGSLGTTNMANLKLITPDYPTGTVPVNPQSSNNFSVNFNVPLSGSVNVDVYADVTNATGTVITALNGTGTGTNSGQTVFLNSTGLSGGSAVTGQTMTIGTGTLTNPPTLNTGSSPVAAFVIGGANSTNQSLATYTFVSSNGASTITELHFGVTGTNVPTDTPITAVHVGGQTGQVLNSGSSPETVTVTGLNIAVPNSSAGLNVPVTVDFAPVSSTNGIASGKTAILTLNYVKYTSGGQTASFTPSVASPTMTLVASRPTVAATQPTNKLAVASIEAIDVNVTADANGDITLNTLPITVGLSGATASSTAVNNIAVYRSTDLTTNIASSNTAFGAITGGTSTITLDNSKTRITAGTTLSLKVFVTLLTVTAGASGSDSMATNLATGAGFSWTDTAGGGTATTGTSLISGYPSTFTSIVNN